MSKNENFTSGLDEVIIVEEKRSFLESHVRNLYNFTNKPRIIGKYDEKNNKLIQENYTLLKSDLEKILGDGISKNCNYESIKFNINLKRKNLRQ